MAGVKVPKLGTVQSKLLHAHSLRKAGQNQAHTRFLAQIAMGIGEGDKKWARDIQNMWNSYVRSIFYIEDANKEAEINMQKEYALISKLRPIMSVAKDGGLEVKGIPK